MRKRAHGTGYRNALRLGGHPLSPFCRLINRDGQDFRRIYIFGCALVLDQRKNCPLDAPQTSARSSLSVVTDDTCVCADRLLRGWGIRDKTPGHSYNQTEQPLRVDDGRMKNPASVGRLAGAKSAPAP